MINFKEFAQRRSRLMKLMGAGSVAIVMAPPHLLRNADVEYPYRPDSNFYYLSGFDEPDAVLVLLPGKTARSIMFCQDRNPEQEIWTGARAGPEGVCLDYAIDEAFPIEMLDDKMPELLEGCTSLYSMYGRNSNFDSQIFSWVNRLRVKNRTGVKAPVAFCDVAALLNEMRLIKSSGEIKTMRRAAKITAEAHIQAMRTARPGQMEFEVAADIQHVFNKAGATFAYQSIVGSGANSCVLHYINNNQAMNDGDLLLIDAGAEVNCYAADVTRTFPINGRFSKEQKAIYEIVLQAQKAAIKQVKPGNLWNAPHKMAVKVIVRGLLKIGLLKGEPEKIIKSESFKKFFMHGTGHWLGMDVHDVGDYKINRRWRRFEPGMMLTVEPGIYIPANSRGVAKKWWNIGIRIEDDILVSKTGHEVITSKIPKEISELESLVGHN